MHSGFTLIELLATVGALIILCLIGLFAFYNFQEQVDIGSNFAEMVSAIKLSQSKALASENNSQWGVYFSTSTPSSYTIFQGVDYASRTTSFDEVHLLPEQVELWAVDLSSSNQVVFNKITALPNQTGRVSLRLKNKPAVSKTVFIIDSGTIEFATSTLSDNTRVKDSRHLHIDYSRIISTTTESVVLIFNEGVDQVVEQIPIAGNITAGNFFWQGKIEVDGETQQIIVHTHRLNSPDSQFCVHRDRRFNSVSLLVDIDGDTGASPNIVGYTAEGSVIDGFSVSADPPLWQ